MVPDGRDAEPLQEPGGRMRQLRQGHAGGTVQRLGQRLALFKSISSYCQP